LTDQLERLEPASRADWRSWLAAHAAESTGVWVVMLKQSTGRAALSYDDVVEEALCFGWVDSKSKGLDDERTMLLLTPRKPGGGWSRPNKLRVERLEQAGAMTAAGLAVIEAAKADGSWTLLDSVDALEAPADLLAALAASPVAAAAWQRFTPGAQKRILLWLVAAKRPETRASRIAETVRLAAEGTPART
jgi:uncharacterized protein YdeI (YjbR/CyaY-like superfamily)